jgi:RNA polymerase sigma factor (sigma-70 family)
LRQKILNILGHLSQSLQQNKDLFYDADQIWEELSSHGFSEEEILGALSHIEKTMLEEIGPFWSQDIPVCRVYSPKESNQISCKARGYLWKLKVRGIIDHALEDEIIEKAIRQLPERQRQAFLLRYWEELDVAEAAIAMGCSEGSVKTHCSRAVHSLSGFLKEKGISL